MKIVVDSNRIFAALIKEGTTREIISSDFFEFFAPEFIKIEIEKYESVILKSARITKKEFDLLFSLIFENITIIPREQYLNFYNLLKNEIDDHKDIPYLSACLCTGAGGIWTHDPHFLKQDKCKVFTNIDMLRFSGKTKN